MKALKEGNRDFRFTHPDDFREYIRNRKRKDQVDKVLSSKEAVASLVSDGDYIVYDFSSLTRGPQGLIREIIRQKKRDLWVGAEFTLHETTLLVGAGCVSRIDVGFLGYGPYIGNAACQGKVTLYEWTNGGLALRILAGSRGIPFIPTRDLLGSDNIKQSGAMVVVDPYTSDPVCLLPSLNPDVALIHVHQADLSGNGRIFGTNLFALEAAIASKKVILSTEEIIGTEEFRKDPQKTTIPYFCVDAVVYQPLGAYPGCMPGHYEIDLPHISRLNSLKSDEEIWEYLEENVFSLDSHEEFLEKRVGADRIKELTDRSVIKEGYR